MNRRQSQGFFWGYRKADWNDFKTEKDYKWPIAHGNDVVGKEALVLGSSERFPDVNFFGMNPGIISLNVMSGVLGENSFY